MVINLIIKMQEYFLKFKRFLYSFLVIIILVVIGTLRQSTTVLAQETDFKPLRIGTFLSITGQASFIGAPALATLKLYVNLLNLQGGLLGRKVELIDYDVGTDPRTAQIAVRRLIYFDKVDAIIGGSTLGATMSVLPIISDAKIPLIALANSRELINPVRNWVFKSSQTHRMACNTILNDMQGRGIESLGLISGDSGFASTTRAHCIEIAKILGISIISDERYRSQTRNVVEPLKRIKTKLKVQAVLNIDFGSSPAYVTREFRKLGFDVPLYQTHGVATLNYLDLSGVAAEGVKLPVPPIMIAEKLDDEDPIKSILLSYIKLYEGRWEVRPSVYGSYAFDAIHLYASAIRRAGSFEREKIRKALERTENYIGANGLVKMSSEDHMGLYSKAFRMVEIRDGEWVPID
jgi:branched-chain amino acid transport system substrate-binding protein